MKSVVAVRIDLRASRLAGAFIAASYVLTAALVAMLPGDSALRGLAVIGVGAHGWWMLRSVSLRTMASSIVAVELAPDRRVTLTRRDGRRIVGTAKRESYVGALLTTLVVREDGREDGRAGSHALLLLPDMAEAAELRRFRVLLRLGREELAG